MSTVTIRVTYGNKEQTPEKYRVEGKTFRDVEHSLQKVVVQDGVFYMKANDPNSSRWRIITKADLDNYHRHTRAKIYYGIRNDTLTRTKIPFDSIKYPDTVRRMIKKGADLSLSNFLDKTALRVAIDKDIPKVVQILLDAGVDPNPLDGFWTPLRAAAQMGHLEIVQQLLRAGASPDQKDEYGTPLSAAIKYGHNEVVRTLLAAKAVIGSSLYDAVYEALTKESNRERRLDIIRALLDFGADPNFAIEDETTPLDGTTPLHLAAIDGDLEIVQMLMDAGAENRVNANGRTPFYEAFLGGHYEVMDYIKDYQPLPPIKEPEGM